MSICYNPGIITDGLIWGIDPGNIKSYPGTGTNIKNILTASSNSLSGTSYSYDTTSYAVPVLALNNNGTDSTGTITCTTADLNALSLTQNFTVMFAAKKNFYGIGGNNNGNSQLMQGVVNGYGSGWRIIDTRQSTPGAAFTTTHNFSFGYNDQFTSLTIGDTGTTNRMSICAFTVSPTTILAFLNSATTTRSNPLTYVSGTSAPQISYTGAGAGSFNGLIGFFMIYNRALTLAELMQNYNSMRGRYNL
jgi:hypothetical protein